MSSSHLKCAGISNWGRSGEVCRHWSQRAPNNPPDAIVIPTPPVRARSTCARWIRGSKSHHMERPVPEAAGRPSPYRCRMGPDATRSRATPATGGRDLSQYSEQDMRRILSHPATMIGSDGIPGTCPHPRLWGTFPRVLGRYSRELKLISLARAIFKMTACPREVRSRAARPHPRGLRRRPRAVRS